MLPAGQIFSFRGFAPVIDSSAYVAPGSLVIGRVTLGPRVHILFNCVLRGDVAAIEIGEGSNIQDNSTVHGNQPGAWNDFTERPAIIGKNVSVGHNCLIHARTIEEGSLIGMGAIVMSRAVIGHHSIVAAGAVVLEDMVVPPCSLVAGVPATVRKTHDAEYAVEQAERPALPYQQRIEEYRDSLRALPYP